MNIAKTLKLARTSGSGSSNHVVAIGLGGAGIDFLTHIMDADLKSIHCVAADIDPYHLQLAKAHTKFPLTSILKVTAESDGDLGDRVSTGMKPLFSKADVVFVLAGMGGETGSAIAPTVAEAARMNGALTIGLVTQPFHFELERLHAAIDGIRKMLSACDTLILIDNHQLEPSTLSLPFRFERDTPGQICCSVVESITHSFANSTLSSADLGEFRSMLRRGGLAKAGVGHSYSHLGSEEATLRAIRNTMPLGDLTHANGIFVNIAGRNQVEHRHLVSTLALLSSKMNPNAQLMYGHRIDPTMQGLTRVTLLATGIVFPFTWGGYRKVPLDIYDLEPDSSTEQTLGLELELDQLESCAY